MIIIKWLWNSLVSFYEKVGHDPNIHQKLTGHRVVESAGIYVCTRKKCNYQFNNNI